MAYVGATIPIALGEIGLRTDAPMTSLPPNALIKANNISMYSGKIEKAKGSLLYSPVGLGAEIVYCFDWWPDSISQRMIALCADGNLYRDTGDKSWTGLVPINSVEVQKFTFNYAPVGGAFSVSFGGFTTPSIPYSASVADFQTAIRTIPPLVGATVALASDGGILVQMNGTSGDQPLMTQGSNTLISNYVQSVTFSGTPTAGNFFLTYGSQTTVAIPYTATALTVQNALRQLTGLAGVTVSGSYASGFTITMVGVSAPTAFTVTNNTLVNGTTAVTTTVTPQGTVTIAFSEVAKGKTSLGTVSTDAHMTAGGQEEAGKDKKLFIFTAGASQIQVLRGDLSSMRDIEKPSPDWANGNYPTFGLIYQGRLCVFGCASNPHQLYFSTIEDHEDFTTDAPPTFAVFPGESDGLRTAGVYRGLMFLFKEPFGVYTLNGTDPVPLNWTLTRFAGSFGVQSPHSVLQVLTDFIAANSSGSYTSLTASDSYGDFEAGDVLANNLVEEYIRSIFNQNGIRVSSCVYYPEKKLAYFTGQSSVNDERNQMLIFDVARNTLRVCIDTKERPNCLELRRDQQRIQRPMYGDKAGFIWLMDQSTYNRNGVPYVGEFQTAYTDFSSADPSMGSKNKIFDFLEINYVPTGNNAFFVDVYVDGDFRQTLKFEQRYGAVLDAFVLDKDKLAGDPSGSRNRKQLKSCTGSKISFRVYNNSSNEGFKIERLIVSFRLSAEQVYETQT